MKNFFARGKDKLCGTTGDLVMLAFVRMVTTALGLLVTKLMAVHFSLQQYGTYSQAMLLQSTATSITILGLTDAVSYFYNKAATRKEKQRYLSTIFALQYVMGSGCAVLLLVFQIPLIRYFDNESLRSVLLYVAWMPLVNNLLPMLQVLYVSIGRTKQIAVRNLLVSLIQLLAVWCACYVTGDIRIIFILLLISGILQIVYFKRTFDRESVAIRLRYGDRKLLPEILKFSVPMAISVMTNALARDIDKYVVSFFTDTETLAVYTNAAKVLPFDIVTSSMLTILVPVITRQIAENNFEKARETFRIYLRMGYVFTWILVAGAVVMAKELMVTLYSEKYLSGLGVFVIYLVVDMVRFSNASLVLTARGKSRRLMVYALVSLASNYLLDIFLFKHTGIFGPALATLLVMLVMNWMLLQEAANVLQISAVRFFDLREVAVFVIELLLCCILAVVVRRLLYQITQNAFFILLGGYGFYFVAAVLFNRKRIISCCKSLNCIQ